MTEKESAAGSITSWYPNGINQSSARAAPFMKACIIFWINAQQVRTCQQLIVREA